MKMDHLIKHFKLRKEYEVKAEQKIVDDPQSYIKALETEVLAFREKYGPIEIPLGKAQA
jgi:hypothetical protein